MDNSKSTECDSDEILMKMFEFAAINMRVSTEMAIEHIETKLKLYQNLLRIHNDNPPFFMFKKAVSEHEEKRREYEKKISDTFDELYEEYSYFAELTDAIKKD